MIRLALLAALLATPAFAHGTEGGVSGFASGFLHPFGGADHMAAMVAVGIWGSVLGMPMLLALPLAFPAMMAVGAVLGILGVPFPPVEIGIALSAVVLGLAIVLSLRVSNWIAVAVVAVFALFHGYAHGAELGPATAPLPYAAGFVVATGLLHVIGIGIGEAALRLPVRRVALGAAGATIAALGLVFLRGAVA